MHITNILYFDRHDSEAEVSVSDGLYTVNCYAYPVNSVSVNQCVNGIYGFECTNIEKTDKEIYMIKKLSQYYAYMITAQVIAKDKGTVQVGKLCINLDAPIPNDILIGDYITFSVLRLDCDFS